MSDKAKIEVVYENPSGEPKWVETVVQEGDTRVGAVLDIVRNGFQIETDTRGVYKYIPPHRIVQVVYVA